MPGFEPVPFFQGVYAIRSRLSGAMYIGCTRNLRSRWMSHLWALRHGRHDQPLLQMAWDADGQAAFELVMLERVEGPHSRWEGRDKLRRAERRWLIDLMMKGTVLYNRTLPRSGLITVVDETRLAELRNAS